MNDIKRKDRTASLKHERDFYKFGFRHIMGLDEAGRGTWAGPVAVGAVALPLEKANISKLLKGVKDSKQMTHLQRVATSEAIQEHALAWGVGQASAAEINDLGINPATRLAMRRALDAAKANMNFVPDCLFLDYMAWPEVAKQFVQLSIVGGDQLSLSIAAASVLAKVWRDDYMVEVDAKYPQYGFAAHKGYGTAAHRDALAEYGPSAEHRLNYRPIRALLEP